MYGVRVCHVVLLFMCVSNSKSVCVALFLDFVYGVLNSGLFKHARMSFNRVCGYFMCCALCVQWFCICPGCAL